MTIYKITELYFKSFQSKNIDFFRKNLCNDVKLIDWEVNLEGIEKVLDHMEYTFNYFKTIEINSLKIDCIHNISFSEFSIRLDNLQLEVIDRINFDDDRKIKSIRAFKG